jgi:hypothetical protein
MSGTEIERRRGRVGAAARKDDELLSRAAKRTDLAGTALASAAGDLDNAHGRDGNALTGLAEVILDEAGRVSHLVEDIESHRPAQAEHSAGVATVVGEGRRNGTP